MTDPGNTLDIVPVESQSSALVATAKSSNSDILALALALTQQQDLRRRRDDFEILADDQFFEKLTDVSCYLEALHYYRRGGERFQVFTFAIIRTAFERACASLFDDEGKSAAAELNLDQWYFDSLPDEIKFGPEPAIESISMMTANQGNHSVDWMGALTKIEQRFPGYVLALHSAMRRQNEMQDKMRVQFSNAMNYARGAEPMAHLGRDILRPISVRDEKGPKLTRSSGGAVRGSLPSGYVVNKY